MDKTQDVSQEIPVKPEPPASPDIPSVSHTSGKDPKSLKPTIRPPTPAKPERPRTGKRGARASADHERKYVEVEAELDLAAQGDPTVGAVEIKTQREVSRLVEGTARARLMPELARMNSHEKILRVLSFTLLRLLRRKMYPDEANAITRLCSTAQKSLDLLGLTGKEAAALAELEAAPAESDAAIRARVNAPTEESAKEGEHSEEEAVEEDVTTQGVSTADPPEVVIDQGEPEPEVLLDSDGDALPIQKDMGPGD